MHLIYFDETGNTGNDLDQTEQPIFVLGALVVPENVWSALEADLLASLARHLPSPLPNDFEIKGSELHNPRGFFRTLPIPVRLALRDDWLAIAHRHGLRLIYRAIPKKRYKAWLISTFGSGVLINPHVAAFPLVARVVDDYLRQLPGSPLGIFIFDENRDVVTDIEKSLRVLRSTDGVLRLGRIIEKGFFIDSRASLPIQLCDLCIYAARRKEEAKAGLRVKPLDQTCIPLVEAIIHRGDERLTDVLAWLADQQKKERPGDFTPKSDTAGPEKGPNRSGR
ncbi:MAG: DUF3800 domain-containing protein [Verrucomicrobia bacterium]|nr:DUF3800 domain-containing protein [Verrucomicrobiota bacterium]